jgi:hypothetical protein
MGVSNMAHYRLAWLSCNGVAARRGGQKHSADRVNLARAPASFHLLLIARAVHLGKFGLKL